MRDLHAALIEIVTAMNRPQRDDRLLREAGVSLDRALFRPLVTVDRLGPIGVVELAARIGLDYTTVSRQVSKLETLGLLTKRESATDGRMRELVVTKKGKTLTDKLHTARVRMAQQVFADWDEKDVTDLVRLMCRLAESLRDAPQE